MSNETEPAPLKVGDRVVHKSVSHIENPPVWVVTAVAEGGEEVTARTQIGPGEVVHVDFHPLELELASLESGPGGEADTAARIAECYRLLDKVRTLRGDEFTDKLKASLDHLLATVDLIVPPPTPAPEPTAP